MPTTKTRQEHIVKVRGICGGRPTVRGTRIAVSEIALRERRGETVHEMLEAWPHLTPSQVHAGLAYYYDHKADIDAEVDQALDEQYWKQKYPPGKAPQAPPP